MHDLDFAVQQLLKGELVAFPTETVYGLGADAENPEAVAKIYAMKERPANHPVIVHLAPNANVSYWVKSIPPQAKALMDAFWPGPLTLIFKRADHIPDAVSGGQDSVGIRCPSHPQAQALLTAFAQAKPNGQGGVAAPSANKFGKVSPTHAEHVQEEFAKEIANHQLFVLTGSESEVGIESTIVDVSRLEEGVPATLLRPGHIRREQLAQVLGYAPLSPDQAAPRASGTLKAHYAPRTPIYPFSAFLMKNVAPTQRHVCLVFEGQIKPEGQAGQGVDWVIMPSDPTHYAHKIYHLLREIDHQNYDAIWVEIPPQTSNWEAVNDRLSRAIATFS